MKIGGYELIIKTTRAYTLVENIKKFLNWPEAVIEFDNIDVDDFFYYKSQATKEAWDIDFTPELENTMVYFLFGTNQLTTCTNQLTICTDKDLHDRIEKYVSENIV